MPAPPVVYSFEIVFEDLLHHGISCEYDMPYQRTVTRCEVGITCIKSEMVMAKQDTTGLSMDLPTNSHQCYSNHLARRLWLKWTLVLVPNDYCSGIEPDM